MAMRLFSAGDFEDELTRRGCRKVGGHPFGTEWQAPGGRSFLVPIPEEVEKDAGPAFPDWMLDDLIRAHGLPAAPLDQDETAC